MRVTILALLALSLAACSTSRPVFTDIPAAGERAGRVVSYPLVEYRHGLFGSTESRGDGTLEVAPDFMVWTRGGRDLFGLRSEVVREVWLNCASELCLELGIRTLTGDTYYFRDRDWRAGGNRNILDLYNRLERTYRSARFNRRAVTSVQ